MCDEQPRLVHGGGVNGPLEDAAAVAVRRDGNTGLG